VKALSPLNVDPIGENGAPHRLVFDGPTLNNPVGSPSAKSLSLFVLVLAFADRMKWMGDGYFPNRA
jgi:hypothetical protein